MSANSCPPPAAWGGGLSDLSGVVLDAEHQYAFEVAVRDNAGNAFWRQRKLCEFQEVLALAQVSGRMHLLMADLAVSLRLMFELRCVVPTLPDLNGGLVLANRALIGLNYPEEAIREPLPGFAFVTLLQPGAVWLPNAAPPDFAFHGHGPGQPLCLGARIAAGTPVKELVLQTYGALTMQSVQLDERDAAGVMNREAAEWWLQSGTSIPLTREGFLESKPLPTP